LWAQLIDIPSEGIGRRLAGVLVDLLGLRETKKEEGSTQDVLRHANPTTTLKHYQKTLSEELIAGVESWDAELRSSPRSCRLAGREAQSAAEES
jgi:hypothetical protein